MYNIVEHIDIINYLMSFHDARSVFTMANNVIVTQCIM